MNSLFPPRTDVLDQLLDKPHPPVARFRIVSNGLAQNHALKVEESIAGTQACLACGNCVDACPVVASKPAGTMFVRTSMLLENIVGSDCRRCFKCVAACPQVSRPVKDHVRGFRRIERASHWDILVAYLILMASGILINHWGAGLPEDLRTIFSIVHRIFTVALVAGPLFLLFFDRRHFALMARKAFANTGAESSWFRNSWKWFTTFGKEGELHRGAFNPGQRFWYIYAPTIITLFAISGIIKWLGPQVVGQSTIDAATTFHVVIAVMTDVLLVVHIYLKLGWPILRDFARGTRQYFDEQRREKSQDQLRTVGGPR